jgi:CO dehydrogenase/acetyl-CoA synthase beta subunit
MTSVATRTWSIQTDPSFTFCSIEGVDALSSVTTTLHTSDKDTSDIIDVENVDNFSIAHNLRTTEMVHANHVFCVRWDAITVRRCSERTADGFYSRSNMMQSYRWCVTCLVTDVRHSLKKSDVSTFNEIAAFGHDVEGKYFKLLDLDKLQEAMCETTLVSTI